MDFRELLSSAIEALALNKLRTSLATLGIIIGIGSVIALISLGQASQQSVTSRIQSLGSNLLTIIPGAQNNGAIREALGSITTLTNADATAIQSSPQITDIQTVSPEYSKRTQVTAGSNNTNAQIIGAINTYVSVHNVQMSEGRFISSIDNQSLAKVAVLGPQVAINLFTDESDPVGQTIRINKIAFRIIGITVSKGGSGFQNSDDSIYIPLLTAQQQVFGVNYLTNISLSAKSSASTVDAENQIGYLLLSLHKLRDPLKADFSILSQADILGAATQITGILTSLLTSIAAISLLVGGIGIMNIMLVTVTERVREIGLRKALGASKNTIILQFLVEAIILTIGGGILGTILGIVISYIVTSFMGLPFVLSLFSIFMAIGVSGTIGIIFGWYPAKKAANLSPMEALRYE